MSSRAIGILQILASGLAFGLLGPLGKLVYQKGVTGGELLSMRFLIGGTLLASVALVTQPQALRLPRKMVLVCLGLGVLGYAVFSSCYFKALEGLSVSMTVLLLYTYPVQVTAGAWLIFGERVPKSRWLALPLVLLGLVLLIWGDTYVTQPSALIFGFLSAFFYSIYILVSSHQLKAVSALASVIYIQLGAGLALATIHWRDPSRIQHIWQEAWPEFLAVAFFCSVIAMSLFLAGLKRLKNWEVSILSTAEPVTGILIATFFMGESLSWMQTAGAAAVLSAFVWVAVPPKNKGELHERSRP